MDKTINTYHQIKSRKLLKNVQPVKAKEGGNLSYMNRLSISMNEI
jgi:hypothetical protein